MATIYYEKDADLAHLNDKTVAIIGYGSQGHAHALNLHDSGIKVVVGLRPDSQRRATVEADGLTVLDTADAAKAADIIMILAPDTQQPQIFGRDIEPNLVPGNAVAFAHGLCIHYGRIQVPAGVDCFMIAPKGPGHLVRSEYEGGGGVPCLLAIQQDATGHTKEVALAYALGIGGARAAVLETTFKEETETDLFGEQTVLCGGVTSLVKAAFETLVDAGYQPEVAFFECLHELKLIVDLFYQGGLSRMWYSVSETAEYGGLTRGPKVIGQEVRAALQETLAQIQSGEFADEWFAEVEAGGPNFNRLREADRTHKIEQVGGELRKMMTWLPQEGH